MIEIVDSRELTDVEKRKYELQQEIEKKQQELKELETENKTEKQDNVSINIEKVEINNTENLESDENKLSKEDNDKLTPEQEKIVSEAIKYDASKMELSDEELEKIRQQAELEYKSIESDVKFPYKHILICIAIIILAFIFTNMLKVRSSYNDIQENSIQQEEITIDVTDTLNDK